MQFGASTRSYTVQLGAAAAKKKRPRVKFADDEDDSAAAGGGQSSTEAKKGRLEQVRAGDPLTPLRQTLSRVACCWKVQQLLDVQSGRQRPTVLCTSMATVTGSTSLCPVSASPHSQHSTTH